MRVFVLDEADYFFKENSNLADLQSFYRFLQTLNIKIQYVFFSATFEKEVAEEISKILKEAYQIDIKTEKLSLDNVQQFYFQCPHKGKIDFIKEIFDSFATETQTIIFVNTRDFAEKVFFMLKKEGYPAAIIFSKMDKAERDEYT